MGEARAKLTDIVSLAEAVARLAEQRLPPVDSWHPARRGHSGIRIDRGGRWLHDGAPIEREAMVRLFSTVLRREADGRYVLVTPAEMLDIDVEDAPFLAVGVSSEGEGPLRTLGFRLNTGDFVIAGPDNGIEMRAFAGQLAPYLRVRGGLDARIVRPVYYELADAALAEAAVPPGLWSNGTFFALGSDA
jgi:hypothetical protein